MNKTYLSIVVLSDSDPHNEVIYTYANMTLERALGIYREENRKETGVVIVHDGESFTCLGRLTEVELQIGV